MVNNNKKLMHITIIETAKIEKSNIACRIEIVNQDES